MQIPPLPIKHVTVVASQAQVNDHLEAGWTLIGWRISETGYDRFLLAKLQEAQA